MMPSPFPGMDPYLENPLSWKDVHGAFIYAMRAFLSDALPEGFLANVDQYLRIEETAQRISPDVTLTFEQPTISRGGTAVLERPFITEKTPPILLRKASEESSQRFIEIVALGTTERVVTTIELLSPANKQSGRGREEYIAKRRAVEASDINLLEIDLLRAGEYSVAAPPDEVLINAHYRVSLHRVGSEIYEVWPILLRDSLPTVRVPLTAEYPDVYLDLQEVLNRIYKEGRFHQRLKYAAEPVPSLSPEDTNWADVLLREKGLR